MNMGPAAAAVVAVMVDVLAPCYCKMMMDSRRRRNRTGCSSACPGRTTGRPMTRPGVGLAPEQGSVRAMISCSSNYLVSCVQSFVSFLACWFVWCEEHCSRNGVEVVQMIVLFDDVLLFLLRSNGIFFFSLSSRLFFLSGCRYGLIISSIIPSIINRIKQN